LPVIPQQCAPSTLLIVNAELHAVAVPKIEFGEVSGANASRSSADKQRTAAPTTIVAIFNDRKTSNRDVDQTSQMRK
jgi:hypothetical protein